LVQTGLSLYLSIAHNRQTSHPPCVVSSLHCPYYGAPSLERTLLGEKGTKSSVACSELEHDFAPSTPIFLHCRIGVWQVVHTCVSSIFIMWSTCWLELPTFVTFPSVFYNTLSIALNLVIVSLLILPCSSMNSFNCIQSRTAFRMDELALNRGLPCM
jgi:hypothetical protein